MGDLKGVWYQVFLCFLTANVHKKRTEVVASYKSAREREMIVKPAAASNWTALEFKIIIVFQINDLNVLFDTMF